MNKRYRLTRSMQANAEAISLEECKQYFDGKADFTYSPVLHVQSADRTQMTVEGDFFMWNHDGLLIPFRHYEGDLYVSGVHDAVIPKMLEIASALHADVMEG